MTKHFEKSCLIHFWMIVFLLLFTSFSFAEQSAEQNQAASAGTGPSFDCSKAKTEVEKLICGSGELSKMDLELSETYKKIASGLGEAEKASLKKEQIEWIKGRSKRIEEGILPADKPEDVQKKKEANLKKEYEARIAVIKAQLDKQAAKDSSADNGKTPANQNQEKSGADKASVSGEKPQDKKLAESASQKQSPFPPPVKTEAEKAQRVKAILGKEPLIIDKLLTDKKDRRMSTELYEALKRGNKSVEYIEPILRTDDPNHPELKSYHSCDKNIRNEDDDYEGLFQIGERNFRLYRLDLDGNSQNGLEEYLFGEVIPEHESPVEGISTGYHCIDLKSCKFISGIGSSWDFCIEHAIIKYKGNHYIFRLMAFTLDEARQIYSIELELYRYSFEENRFISPAFGQFLNKHSIKLFGIKK